MQSVALIEPVGGHGGMSQYDLALADGLYNAGWSTSWYTCTETSAPSDATVRFFPVYKGIWGKANKLKRAYRYLLGSLITLFSAVRRQEKVCHLHFFNGAPEELMLLVLSRIFGRKVVLTVHDVESFAVGQSSRSKIVAHVYNLAHRLVVHNQTSRHELKMTLGIRDAKITVIPHGNYLGSIGRTPTMHEAKRALGVRASQKVVLFFGQIKEVKGLDLLLQAMEAVLKVQSDVTLVIAGRPWKADFGTYERMIRDLGLAGHCKLHIGYVPDDEISTFYASADVVVLPYRRIYQSGVLLLAMSYAKAVIVSSLPGMLEVVTRDRDGYVFISESTTSLAHELLRALQNDQERELIALRAFERVQTSYSWNAIGRQMATVYEEIC